MAISIRVLSRQSTLFYFDKDLKTRAADTMAGRLKLAASFMDQLKQIRSKATNERRPKEKERLEAEAENGI